MPHPKAQNFILEAQLEQIRQLQEQVTTLLSENKKLAEQLERLSEQNEYLIQKLYGSKSEKTNVLNNQLCMDGVFNEVEASSDPSAAEPDLYERPLKKSKKGYKRAPNFAGLEQVDEIITLSKEDQVCPECHGRLSSIGKKFLRQEIRVKPAEITIANMYQESFECRTCKKQNPDAYAIYTNDICKPVLPHSFASASAIAHTLHEKFAQAVPLYRQEKFWKEHGVNNIDRSVLSNWLLKTSELYFIPLVDYMAEIQKKEHVLFMDETPVQVLKEKDRENRTKSYMWVLASDKRARHKIRIFRYAPGRGRIYAKEALEGFKGYLHTDGYVAYNDLGEGILRCQCWAHVRRNFADILKLKTAEEQRDTLAAEGLAFCNKLFELEAKWKELPSPERKERRLKESKPLLKQFFQWAEKSMGDVLPKSKIGTAIAYALTSRSNLCRFLEDGDCDISTNTAENSIRPFTVGRKNWLFAGSPAGAHASAAIYSLLETAKQYGLPAREYFQFVLNCLPNNEFKPDPERFEEVLPWNIVRKSTQAES